MSEKTTIVAIWQDRKLYELGLASLLNAPQVNRMIPIERLKMLIFMWFEISGMFYNTYSHNKNVEPIHILWFAYFDSY